MAGADARGDRGPRSRWHGRRPLILAVVAGLFVCLWLAVSVWETLSFRHQLAVQAAIDAEVGFTCGTPIVNGREVFVIESVAPGKPMAQAGLRAGDRIRLRAVPSLYRRIALNQGGQTAIPIERDGTPLTVVVDVPKLQLP